MRLWILPFTRLGRFIKNKLVNGNNLINLVEKFINEYANDFGFDISRSMKILKTNIKQEKILQCIQRGCDIVKNIENK